MLVTIIFLLFLQCFLSFQKRVLIFHSYEFLCIVLSANAFAKPHSSVSSIADLRTGGRWFDPRLGQYSFRGLMKGIATGFIPLSLLSIDWTMVMWESSQWLGKNIVMGNG